MHDASAMMRVASRRSAGSGVAMALTTESGQWMKQASAGVHLVAAPPTPHTKQCCCTKCIPVLPEKYTHAAHRPA